MVVFLIVRPFVRGFAFVFTGRVTLVGFFALGFGLDAFGGGGGTRELNELAATLIAKQRHTVFTNAENRRSMLGWKFRGQEGPRTYLVFWWAPAMFSWGA